MDTNYVTNGPMAINQCNLYITISALVLGRYGVLHANVNGT